MWCLNHNPGRRGYYNLRGESSERSRLLICDVSLKGAGEVVNRPLLG